MPFDLTPIDILGICGSLLIAAAYFAVRGPLPALWKEQKGGRVSIDEVGFCSYLEEPEGEHVLVTRSCPPGLLASLIEGLMTAPPKKPGGR